MNIVKLNDIFFSRIVELTNANNDNAVSKRKAIFIGFYGQGVGLGCICFHGLALSCFKIVQGFNEIVVADCGIEETLIKFADSPRFIQPGNLICRKAVFRGI